MKTVTPKNHAVKMSFVCNQDWDKMKTISSGKYCEMCKKNVHDFTSKSINEINQFKTQNGSVCGTFTINQVEPNLVPIDFILLRKAKKYFATVFTFIGLEIHAAETHKPKEVKIERLAVDSINCSEIKPKQHRNSIFKRNSKECKDPESTSFRSRGKGWYLSSRFPFIVRRHYRVVGARF